MSGDNTVIISAILAFLSTTIDDFAVLLMFYGKAANDPVLMANQGFLKVTIGQFIGFTVVVGISLLGRCVPNLNSSNNSFIEQYLLSNILNII